MLNLRGPFRANVDTAREPAVVLGADRVGCRRHYANDVVGAEAKRCN